MAPITRDDVIQILKMVNESQIDELHLEMDDVKLVIKKRGQEDSAPPLESIPKRRASERNVEAFSVPETDEKRESVKPFSPQTDVPKPAPIPIDQEDGLIPIKAPMLGVFYRAPKPDAPPFVEVGQFIAHDDVVCIIEVMKLFNMVRAGMRGRVAKICAENAQLVEYQQVLFLLENVEGDKNPS
jgi:acetyl-CoA carboxylase biotin carboxyl carrier protein